MPVLFYIHGGAFIYGSASNYDGGLLSTKGKVVLVTTNYRVSSLGFLSTGSSAAEGNYGLLDQIAALKWVQENIASFGGDASTVTVMGQSAGSASVSHLSLSPEAKGLFKRVILVSGSASAYFGYSSHQPLLTRRLADYYKCPTGSDEATVDCLRDESAYTLNLRSLVYPPLNDQYLCVVIPRVDGKVVPIKPFDAMTAGYNADYDMLVGSTEHDAQPFSLTFASSPETVDFYLDFMFSAFQNKEQVLNLLKTRYPEVTSSDKDIRERSLVKLATDFVFGSRALKEAELHSK